MTTVPKNADLQAVCDICLQAIRPGEGAVWADQDAAWQAVWATPTTSGRACLAGQPAAVEWQTDHTVCVEIPGDAFTIPVEEISRWSSALHWTAHLISQRWVEATDWSEYLLRSLDPQHQTPGGLHPLQPQDRESEPCLIGNWP